MKAPNSPAGFLLTLLMVVPLLAMAGERNSAADRIYYNARVYTADPEKPTASFIAVDAGRFKAVGDAWKARELIGPDTILVDMTGKTVIPGIHDAHIHLLASQLKFGAFNCDLPGGTQTVASVVESLKSCRVSDRARPGSWLIGGYIGNDLLKNSDLRRALNETFADVPVLLSDFSNHNALVNQKALALAGIDGDTTAPKGGTIEKDADGVPTGLLLETAPRLVYRVIPEYDESDYLLATQRAVAIANRYGITSAQEASAVPGLLRALKRLDDNGEVSLHLAAHIVHGNEKFVPNAGAKKAFEHRHRYATANIDIENVKIWLDGQPLEPFPSHATLDPATGNIDNSFLLFDQDYLNKKVLELDRMGVKVKLHAVGEGAVRAALDAIAYARKRNDSGINHDIAHCNFIAAQDIPRFKKLNVTAEMSPALWHLNIPELADASPFKALLAEGVNVTIGSDWLVLPTPNLFPALASLVDKKELSFATLLPMVTINGAVAMGRSQDLGSIEPGKSADFVVLDRDPAAVSPAELAKTEVLQTVFRGRVVYQR